MPIPVELLTQPALTGLALALRNKTHTTDPTAGVLWDYLTEQGLLDELSEFHKRKLTPAKYLPLMAHRWIVFDAVVNARALKPGHEIAVGCLRAAEAWVRDPSSENLDVCKKHERGAHNAPAHPVVEASKHACGAAIHNKQQPAWVDMIAAAEDADECLSARGSARSHIHTDATNRVLLYLAMYSYLPDPPV